MTIKTMQSNALPRLSAPVCLLRNHPVAKNLSHSIGTMPGYTLLGKLMAINRHQLYTRSTATALWEHACSATNAPSALPTWRSRHIAENKFLTILPPSCDTQMMYSDNVVKNLKNSIF
ncbi:hypothetical protein [Lactococcus fujiensis]|uniref:hypothetical protein n=1 Tax=Lactococcus fujiensis TaxID=610251 RepID=UPI00117BC52D|nr:hypothetical protein [Lactococcus fujiensis]